MKFNCVNIFVTEKLLVKVDPGLYQGCLDVDGMDDKEEMRLADVCKMWTNYDPCY